MDHLTNPAREVCCYSNIGVYEVWSFSIVTQSFHIRSHPAQTIRIRSPRGWKYVDMFLVQLFIVSVGDQEVSIVE